MTARRRARRIDVFDYAALLVALGVTVALLAFGVLAKSNSAGRPGSYIPYFVFGVFAALVVALDLKVIINGGIVGTPRVARHLWRMCFALFFATAFFFLGQQKVMPAFIQRSPVLVALAIAPLVVMIFWLIRVRSTNIPGLLREKNSNLQAR